MSSARKRTDLIERTRYPNPLPLPPYPPKLLSIPTPATRYADPTWSSRLAESVPLPLVVDAEGGMPLDLNAFPELWATDERGRPIPIGDATLPPLEAADVDAEDAWLLDADLGNAPIPPPATGNAARTSSSSSSHLLAVSQGDPSAAVSRDGTPDVSAKDVAWLRRTEYLGADRKARAEAALRNAKPSQSAAKDVSPESEVARINDTFAAIEKQPLGDASLRHPNPSKRHLEPVECLDVFPDFDTWATDMHVFKFADAPGKHDVNDEATAAATSSTLPLSILRPRTDNLTRRTLVSMYVPSSEPTDIPIEDFDRLLLADEDAFVDDEERELYGGPEGDQLDKEARMRAVVRREEMRRRKGWVGQLPLEPEEVGEGEEGDEQAEARRNEFLKLRAEVTTPYRHQRDYDPERQGVEEDLARLLVLSFDAESDDQNAPAKLPLTEREATYLNSTASSSSSSASRAVYYHPITSRTTLRVKRQRRLRGTSRTEDDEEHWTDLALTHRDVTDKELVRRLRKRVEVEAGGLREDELPELSESEDEAEEEEEEEEKGTPKANGKHAQEEDDSAEAAEEEEPGAAARRAARARAAFSDDEDEEEEAGAKPAEGGSSKKAEATAADDEEEEEDDEDEGASKPRKSNRSDSGSSGEEDEDDEEDDDIDADEELAALREEAGDDAPAEEEEAGEGRSRRSRRAAATAVAAPAAEEEDGKASGEAAAKDDDEMDED